MNTWLLTVGKHTTKIVPEPWGPPTTKVEFHEVTYRFLSDAAKVEEAFEAIYSSGFCCVVKSEGVIRACSGLIVKLALEKSVDCDKMETA